MQEKISALMDGELDAEDAASVIAQFRKTDGLREQWAVYHLISDILGQSEARPFDVSQRVSARLATEPLTVRSRRTVACPSKAKADCLCRCCLDSGSGRRRVDERANDATPDQPHG